ncbi:hypothetical protein O181_111461 [Austropuccinia psidii MF-1]|uniref:Uncharacterized protein n=1 Tax=Austropuccinia psidii MF-1 TaxID=1389203 RepID=A0A9Q3PSP3_9BASI|nr:hypothetical protein [Austropuccinia psidii MF-1]
MVQRSSRGKVGNIPKPLAGGYKPLLTHQELFWVRTNHRVFRRMEPIVLQIQVQRDNSWLKNQSILSVEQKKELELTPALEKEEPVASNCFNTAPEIPKDKPKGPQKKQKCCRNNQGNGRGKENWHIPYPQGYRIPTFEPSAMDSVLNMTRALMELTAREKERINGNFPFK